MFLHIMHENSDRHGENLNMVRNDTPNSIDSIIEAELRCRIFFCSIRTSDITSARMHAGRANLSGLVSLV